MRRVEEGVAAILIAIEDRLTFCNLNIAKRSFKPALFRFSRVCLALFLIITISSLLTPNSNSLLPTIQGQGSDNETAPPDIIVPEGDTTPPDITVPDDIIVEATSPNGTPVQYAVTAEDDVDGTAILEHEDGSTVTQDGVRANITISCDPSSGFEFPIGNTAVECIATDASGNEAKGFFTIRVQEVEVGPQSPTVPLTVGIISNVTEGVAPATFEFQANLTGGSEPYTYLWDFGDGSEESDKQTVLHTFEEAGTYMVTLATRDTDDQDAYDSLEITVNESLPPPPPPAILWIILSAALASIVIGGIALSKYKMNQRRSRRLKIPPSAIVEITAKGGIDQ